MEARVCRHDGMLDKDKGQIFDSVEIPKSLLDFVAANFKSEKESLPLPLVRLSPLLVYLRPIRDVNAIELL